MTKESPRLAISVYHFQASQIIARTGKLFPKDCIRLYILLGP